MAASTTDDVLEALQPIFREALDDPGLRLSLDSNARNTRNWDSLAHIDIIEMVQQRFRMKFALGELQELKDVHDLVTLITKKQQSSTSKSAE